MHDPLMTKSFKNGGAAIGAYRIVKFGSADDTAAQASAATDYLLGISNNLGAAATDTRFDVHLAGIAEVEYGGNVTRGQPLTADGDGKAIAAAPQAGANMRIIGFAVISGVSGDIGAAQVAPGQIQG